MGLGKTIQVLSLITTDPYKDGQPTLIVSPLSVMSNWKIQAAQPIKEEYAPKIFIYHNLSKSVKQSMTPENFKEYDIVLTTYETMTGDVFVDKEMIKESQSSGLFSVNWRRVVLDEGHRIRTPKAKLAQAAHRLESKSRWVLSGTPIVNNLKDLYSSVKSLRFSGGLSEFEIFNANIVRPVANGDETGKALLQALMKEICLQRMKHMDFVNLKLPGLTHHTKVIKFLPHEQEQYDAFKAEAKGLLKAAKAKERSQKYTMMLEILLRLRQTCNHWKLVGEARISRIMKLIEESEGKVIDIIDPENKKALQDFLQIKLDYKEDCPLCYETINKNPVITACSHAFCKDCITNAINTQHKCPLCRAELPDLNLLVSPAANFGEGAEELDIDPDETSSKIEAILILLRATEKENNDTKTVVFSQWTSFLNLLEPNFRKTKLEYIRLDGKMYSTQRDAAMERLFKDSNCKITLASLSAFSVGINLTAANQVILADSWWAPAVEDQAIDRVNRLGQTKPCRVIRFVMEYTIEEEVLEIQKRKRTLVDQAFGESTKSKKGEAARQERLEEIERLSG